MYPTSIPATCPWNSGVEYDERLEVVKHAKVYQPKERAIPAYIPRAVEFIREHPGCGIYDVSRHVGLYNRGESSLLVSLSHNRLIYTDDQNRIYLYDYEEVNNERVD